MAPWKLNEIRSKSYVVFLVVFAIFFSGSIFTEGRHPSIFGKNNLIESKGIAHTIESDDGDVVDCVHLHEQPALLHSLLKNHVIQVEPSSYSSNVTRNNSLPELIQSWHKNGECSKGTIPIRRQLQTPSPPPQPHDELPKSNPHYEYATVSARSPTEKKFSGAHATLNVWNPSIGRLGDFSSSQVWVVAGNGEFLNSLQAGWIVYPEKYGDSKTRFSIHWTRDGYNKTGCLDHDCIGFVQVNNRYSLGGTLSPVSVYDGQQFEIKISIYQDKTTGNWWLIMQDIPIGYWPAQLFTGFAYGADTIRWGGQIFDSEGNGKHTTTSMGNGHFPNEGSQRASYFSKLKYFDDSNVLRNPTLGSLELEVTNQHCYNIMVSENEGSNHGVYFFYGGPGYNAACP